MIEGIFHGRGKRVRDGRSRCSGTSGSSRFSWTGRARGATLSLFFCRFLFQFARSAAVDSVRSPVIVAVLCCTRRAVHPLGAAVGRRVPCGQACRSNRCLSRSADNRRRNTAPVVWLVGGRGDLIGQVHVRAPRSLDCGHGELSYFGSTRSTCLPYWLLSRSPPVVMVVVATVVPCTQSSRGLDSRVCIVCTRWCTVFT